MTEHYCMAVVGSGGCGTTHIEDDPRACGKIAHFSTPSHWEDLGDCWYCAECYDMVIEFNRLQNEHWGVPLIQP